MVEFLIEEESEDVDTTTVTEQPEDGGEELQEKEGEETPDEVEELASAIGWRPDGELDAKDYILKSRDIQDTMRTHIQDQKKQLTDLGMSVAELKSHNERVYKAEVGQLKSELDTLKESKREAIEDGDADKVDELDEQIDGVKERMAAPKPDKAPDNNPQLVAWMGKNPWYNDNPEMADYADDIADQNTKIPYDRMLKLVERRVKEAYPDKFEASETVQGSKPGGARRQASPVEGGARRAAPGAFTKADLTSSQKNIMAQFVRQGIMTEKQYIADIAKTQGV